MPKQNRPLVRDGRLQARRKRTDRSYLRPSPAEEPQNEPEPTDAEDEPAASDVVRTAARAAADAPPTAQPNASATADRQQSGKLPTAVRALQQQGVRKRREFDIRALAIRDTNYAKHEIRRIATLAIMVIATLIVLTFVLR